MTHLSRAVFWGLLILGTAQAALGASVLVVTAWVWAVVAVGYAVGLCWLARRPNLSITRLVGLGYLLPLVLFASGHAARTLPGRPEAAEAAQHFRPTTVEPPPASDLPAPRLTTPGGERGAARGVWLLAATAVYLAGCAIAGLFWHTPVAVYVVVVVAVVLSARFSRGSP